MPPGISIVRNRVSLAMVDETGGNPGERKNGMVMKMDEIDAS